MPRGGRRTGRAGASYTNRTDLAAQPVKTAPGQQYGQQAAQARAQQAIPLPAATPVQASPVAQSAPPPALPEPGMLHAPTARPGEPVTAGLPIGPGAGPEANAIGDASVLNDLRAAYRMFPFEEMRQIIERAENRAVH